MALPESSTHMGVTTLIQGVCHASLPGASPLDLHEPHSSRLPRQRGPRGVYGAGTLRALARLGCSPVAIEAICAGQRAMPSTPDCGGTERVPVPMGDRRVTGTGGCRLPTLAPLGSTCERQTMGGTVYGWVVQQGRPYSAALVTPRGRPLATADGGAAARWNLHRLCLLRCATSRRDSRQHPRIA